MLGLLCYVFIHPSPTWQLIAKYLGDFQPNHISPPQRWSLWSAAISVAVPLQNCGSTVHFGDVGARRSIRGKKTKSDHPASAWKLPVTHCQQLHKVDCSNAWQAHTVSIFFLLSSLSFQVTSTYGFESCPKEPQKANLPLQVLKGSYEYLLSVSFSPVFYLFLLEVGFQMCIDMHFGQQLSQWACRRFQICCDPTHSVKSPSGCERQWNGLLNSNPK